jgi:hypothetical protein
MPYDDRGQAEKVEDLKFPGNKHAKPERAIFEGGNGGEWK